MAENEWGKWAADARWEDPKINLNEILYADVDEKMQAAIRNAGVSIEGGAGACRVANPGVDDLKKLDRSPEAVAKRIENHDKIERMFQLQREARERSIIPNERAGEVPTEESRIGGRK